MTTGVMFQCFSDHLSLYDPAIAVDAESETFETVLCGPVSRAIGLAIKLTTF